MNEHQWLIDEIEKYGTSSSGKTALLKYLKGETIHRAAAFKAKCFECTGYHADGRVDCEMPTCPLYPYMPYRGRNTEEAPEVEEGPEESQEIEQEVDEQIVEVG